MKPGIILGFFMAICCGWSPCNQLFAQLDTLHYIPPIGIGNTNGTQGAIYLSTPSLVPLAFTITDGAGNVLATDSVSNSDYFRYSMTGNDPDFIMPRSLLDSVLTDRGFIIRAEGPIYANLRYEIPNQSMSITAKGTKAFGQSFRMVHARSLPASICYVFYSVMATEDNTTVVIDLAGTGIVLLGPNASSTAAPIVLTLNQGESYVIGANISGTNTRAIMDNAIGRLITANRPIVTVMGNWLSSWFNGNYDMGFDQPTSENLLGNQYVLLQGSGSTDKERAIVVANQNNTQVYLNGSNVPVATLNAGDFYEVAGTNYTADSVMFIETSQPIYAWQILFGRNSWANWGLNFLPPVSCLTERFVDNIPAIDSVNNRDFSGNVNLVTRTGSAVLLNGAPPAGPPIPIPGSDFEAYRIHGLTGNVAIQSNSIAVVGTYGFFGASSYAGYFSGFDSVPNISASIQDSLCPDTLFVRSGFDSYQWLINGVPDTTATDTFFPLNGTNGFVNVVVSKGACQDTSGNYTVACFLPVVLDFFDVACDGDNGMSFSWATHQELNTASFTVEASTTGQRWISLDQVPAQGEEHGYQRYEISSRREAGLYNFFRLRQADQDGALGWSQVVTRPCDPDGPHAIVVPHPAQRKASIRWTGFAGWVTAKLYHLDGRLAWEGRVPADQGKMEVELPSGVYLLYLSDGQAHTSRRLVVE